MIKLPYTAKIEQSKPVKDYGYVIPDYQTNMYELHVLDFRAKHTNETHKEETEQTTVPRNRRRF